MLVSQEGTFFMESVSESVGRLVGWLVVSWLDLEASPCTTLNLFRVY